MARLDWPTPDNLLTWLARRRSLERAKHCLSWFRWGVNCALTR